MPKRTQSKQNGKKRCSKSGKKARCERPLLEEDVIDGKLIVMNFPRSIVREMDAICARNQLERSEYILLSASQLLRYLDRRFGRKARVKQAPPEQAPAIPVYEGYDDGDLLAAEENGAEE